MAKNTKTSRNILIAFILNLSFSIYEFIGGALTGSTAIMSDAVHDLGDAFSIGISYFLERKSNHKPDANYTYGYARFSLIGGMITTLILLLGSVFVIVNAIAHIIHPIEINYSGMIILAIIGVIVNFIAAYCTRSNDSLNQKSVNLHMLEDVLGWIVVLIGAIIMSFTNIAYLDPILSIGVAIFILKSALENSKNILDVFLEKTPRDVPLNELQQHLCKIPKVKDVHHIHIWSLDGFHNYATLHAVTENPSLELKQQIRAELTEHSITHSTIEFEKPSEHCHATECEIAPIIATHQHTHHH